MGIVLSCGALLNTVEAQDPPECQGSVLAIALLPSTEVAHVGDTVTYSASVFNEEFPSCRITDISASITTPDGQENEIELDRTSLGPGQSDFYKDVVSYEIREQDLEEGEKGRQRFASASVETEGVIQQNETPSRGSAKQQVNTIVRQPCIDVRVECVSDEGESAQIQYSGTVTNCGNAPLVEVVVSHDVGGDDATVFEAISLAAGETEWFRASFVKEKVGRLKSYTVNASGKDARDGTTVEDAAGCDTTLGPAGSPEIEAIAVHQDNVDLRFSGQTGKHYVVEASPSLNTGNGDGWQIVVQNVVAMAETTTLTVDRNGERRKFFRLKAIVDGESNQ